MAEKMAVFDSKKFADMQKTEGGSGDKKEKKKADKPAQVSGSRFIKTAIAFLQTKKCLPDSQ